MTTVADVRRVLDQHPNLGAFGFGSPPPDRVDEFAQQVDAARRWIAASPDARRIVERRGSYVLKHAAERWAGAHVQNGAFIVAAALSGFQPVHSRYPGPNCRFRAS